MLDPMPRVDLPLPPSTDYLRGLEAGRAETAAAVAAALMQAAEAVKREAWPDDDIYGPDEKQIESAERATVEVAVETILALIPAPAMAALKAERAKARKVKPLSWFEVEKSRLGGKYTADGYTIRYIEGLWLLDFAGTSKSAWRFTDLEAAKAAAQADYEARILAALEPDPAVVLMREALRPFAALAEQVDKWGHEDGSTCTHRIKACDIRRARAALKEE